MAADPVQGVQGVYNNFGQNPPVITEPVSKTREVTGRTKISMHENVFEADFEYGLQPLRWQSFTTGAATIISQPGQGGVAMSVTAAQGDVAIRQSRPYHRYQPGKTMFLATAMVFGGANAGQRQRVGFFDDGNGIFWQQGNPTAANPYGMQCVVRSNISQIPTDTIYDFAAWTDEDNIKNTINWNALQMIFVEYAWYGGGGLRWGVMIDGEPHILHHQATGNILTKPWARTGNLPARYEIRNLTASVATTMYHYGVSVLVDGKQDPQRGFTYAYGMALGTPTKTISASSTRTPLMSIQYRPMGTQEFTNKSAAVQATPTNTTLTVASLPAISSITVSGTTATLVFSSAHGMTAETAPIQNWITISGAVPAALNGFWPVVVVNTTTVTFQVPSGTSSATTVGAATPWTAGQWVGRYIFFPGTGTQGLGSIGLITANTANTITYCDNVLSSPQDGVTVGIATAPATGAAFIIGIINRGLVLPQSLIVSASATCQIEIAMSTPSSPISLTGASFVAENTLGSLNSFTTRDVSATAWSGGEIVMKFTAPAGGSNLQIFDLTKLFPLFNTLQGNLPDILSILVTTPTSPANVGADIIAQEQMS
jgi:hypothetical protein